MVKHGKLKNKTLPTKNQIEDDIKEIMRYENRSYQNAKYRLIEVFELILSCYKNKKLLPHEQERVNEISHRLSFLN